MPRSGQNYKFKVRNEEGNEEINSLCSLILPPQKGIVEMEEFPKRMTKMIKDTEELLYEKCLKRQRHGECKKGLTAHCPLQYN